MGDLLYELLRAFSKMLFGRNAGHSYDTDMVFLQNEFFGALLSHSFYQDLSHNLDIEMVFFSG